MRKKNFLNKILQNTGCPQGFWGPDDFAGNELFSCFVGTSWYETSGMATGMDCP